jgi:hypothetical protein
MSEAIDPRVRNAAIAMTACLVPMFWGVIAREWFTAGHDSVGLAGIEQCHLFCELKVWNDLDAPIEIRILGLSAFLSGLNAFALAVHGIVMLLKGKAEKIRFKWIVWLSIITAGLCIGFLLRMMLGSDGSHLTLRYPGFLAIAGSIAIVPVLYKLVAPLRLST